MDARHGRQCECHRFQPCQYPEMADVHRAGKGLVASPSFHILRVQAGIQEKVFSY